jgi:hypothetical protein
MKWTWAHRCQNTCDEVLTRQCPCFEAFDSWRACGCLADSTASDRNRGCTRIYPGLAPRRVKTYILLVWSCIAGICGAVTMVRRCNLAKAEEDMAWLAYAWDLCEIWCLCEFSLCQSNWFRGRPWWLYICSQLGFTGNFCLLLQVEVQGLAGFMYPSSGLLSWQEPGRQTSRTEGSYPRQHVCAFKLEMHVEHNFTFGAYHLIRWL